MVHGAAHSGVGMMAGEGTRSSPVLLRMLADDLTGALDTAAQFATPDDPVAVWLAAPDTVPAWAVVIDTATREALRAVAENKVAGLARLLRPQPAHLSFFKLDSLLRGNGGAELATLLRCLDLPQCLIAPALPHQGRVMREGLQYAPLASEWQQVGEDISATLQAAGISVHHARPGSRIPQGVSLWDSETDADLDEIVRAGMSLNAPLLWCGSAGIAAALARYTNGATNNSPPLPQGNMLGIFGSHHPVMLSQIGQDREYVLSLRPGDPHSAHSVDNALASKGTAWITFDLGGTIDRTRAQAMIEAAAERLLNTMVPPAILVVSGGETLRALALHLEVRQISVFGQIEPGIPVARFIGGRWHDVTIITKSGAFGCPDWLSSLRLRASHCKDTPLS